MEKKSACSESTRSTRSFVGIADSSCIRRCRYEFSPVDTPALLLLTGLGIFSSSVVANDANEALLAGKACNANLSTTGLFVSRAADIQSYAWVQNTKSAEHLAYALRCYQQQDQQRRDGNQLDTCKLLTTAALKYEVTTNASCPFSPDICKHATGNFRLETGFLDNYKDLGMNKGPRFTIRLQHHCAPLKSEGYRRSHADPQRPGIDIVRYDYGPTGSNASTWVDVPVNTTVPETEQLNSDYNV